EDILQAGAAKARAIATPLLETLREAVGLGKGGVKKTGKAGGRKRKADKVARVVSFRDADGSFRFRLLAANGDQLALSVVHADPKAAGMASRRLLESAADVETREDDGRFAVVLGDEVLAHAEDAAAADRIGPELAALAAMQET
ncbi:MAG TPA: tryptophan--tRNA ligase, partial [Rhodanobacteraceae bacterium]|nr:tryptophan--tRNA ligase [Rhodanobacteraceae bacterium]